MFNLKTTSAISSYISPVVIEYNNGYFEIYNLATPISKHESLQEAQWIKNILDSEA